MQDDPSMQEPVFLFRLIYAEGVCVWGLHRLAHLGRIKDSVTPSSWPSSSASSLCSLQLCPTNVGAFNKKSLFIFAEPGIVPRMI